MVDEVRSFEMGSGLRFLDLRMLGKAVCSITWVCILSFSLRQAERIYLYTRANSSLFSLLGKMVFGTWISRPRGSDSDGCTWNDTRYFRSET